MIKVSEDLGTIFIYLNVHTFTLTISLPTEVLKHVGGYFQNIFLTTVFNSEKLDMINHMRKLAQGFGKPGLMGQTWPVFANQVYWNTAVLISYVLPMAAFVLLNVKSSVIAR